MSKRASVTGYAIPQSRIQHIIARQGYCAVCDGSPKMAKSTHNPPILSADHRELAIQQELFITSPYSSGSPLFLPNGTRIFNTLTGFLRSKYERYGFQEVISPTIYKKSLWEKSGHWENYAEDMYSVTGRGAESASEGKQVGKDEEYGLKPMNCPGHCLIFASKKRSYRDLPIRYADFSPLHRNEISGALSGLTRLRKFHQDDGHIFCRPSQIRDEISKTLEFVKETYNLLKMGPYRLTLSTRPKDHFIGSMEEWANAESALKSSLDASGETWTINEGDGAFYGPKIDIIIKDSNDKEHQTATIQLDFQLPKRFELEYQAPAPELEQKGLTTRDGELLAVEGPVTPVLIHRAVLGSVERMMALLIEHHNGKWPFWLSPRQVIILTLNDKPATLNFAREAQKQISIGNEMFGTNTPIAVDIDDSPRALGKKIAVAKSKHYSIIAIIGDQNVAHGRMNVDISWLLSDAEMPAKSMLNDIRSEVQPMDKTNVRKMTVSPLELRKVLQVLQALRV
ncbi:hypothetical protein BJ878DRAFT_531898 [Calycina marina]|uniref:threonine--tRNA ligase n=1 Tax=Calycina marina TaxID=1763456 RepID=A0A9P8CKE5_9HELO|nr:hypothetical protein BJ878DRAFT_531898 [Calycina marina]